MKIEILNTEIIDQKTPKNENTYCKSGVSVLVEMKVNDEKYHLDYQTTTTHDYGAISSSLSPYTETEDYDKLEKYCEDNDLNFYDVIDEIETKANAQKLWDEYIEENYTTNDDHFGGMDANSEYDEMQFKEE